MKTRNARTAKKYLARAQAANAYILSLKAPPLSPAGRANESTARQIWNIEGSIAKQERAPSRSAAIRHTASAQQAAEAAEKIARQYGYKPA